MKKESQIIIHKRLLMTNNRLAELQNLLSKYCSRINWEASLTDGTTIVFDSFEELQLYSNYGSTKMLKIESVARSEDSKTRIIVTISREHPTLKRFGECRFEFANEDQYTVFRKEIHDFFDRCVEGEIGYQVGRWLLALVLLGTVTVIFTTITSIKVTDKSIILIIICYLMVIVYAFWLAISFSTKIWGLIFPSVVFAIGEGAPRYEKFKKWRSDIFWGVFVTSVISIIIGLLLK